MRIAMRWLACPAVRIDRNAVITRTHNAIDANIVAARAKAREDQEARHYFVHFEVQVRKEVVDGRRSLTR